jgi:hypothetical protein
MLAEKAISQGLSTNDSYAYMYYSVTDTVYSLTKGSFKDSDSVEYEASAESISLKFQSDTVCPFSESGEKFTFTNQVVCDHAIKGQGTGKVLSSHDPIDYDNPCDVVIKTAHESGCIVYTAPSFVQFLVDNRFITGSCWIVLGLVIAFAGQHFFTPLFAKLTGLFTLGFVLCIASVCMWLDSRAGLMIMLVVALFSGFVITQVLETQVMVGIVMTGLFAGLFAGFIMYAGAIKVMSI